MQEEQSSVRGAQSPHLGGQDRPRFDCTLQSNGISKEIEVNCVYEIDHATLPPRAPVQLRSLRVVMVTQRTKANVSVRFPSTLSLQKYFGSRGRVMYPPLDEKFVMEKEVARRVLSRRIPYEEFAEKRQVESFWLVIPATCSGSGNVLSNRSACLSELKGNGMVQWGVRRVIKFIGSHEEDRSEYSSSFIDGKPKLEEEVEEKEDQNEEVDEDETSTEHSNGTKKTRGGKRRASKVFQKVKKAKHENTRQSRTKSLNNCCKQIVMWNPKNRWSTQRYELAEKKLLEVMTAKGATIANPILRPVLRAEARKKIGDTGLLDHLLKHMAGKVAPGGAQRFCRRHNADGAMEYWLESAELVDIRREAGVQDPCWRPPPGWKPGDCPTQDPICARELSQMKEMISKIEISTEDTVTKKELEEEISKLRRDMTEMLTKKEEQGSPAILISNPDVHRQKLEVDKASLIPLKFDLDYTLFQLEKCKAQVSAISDLLNEVEKQVNRKLTRKAGEGANRAYSTLMVATEACVEKEKGQAKTEKGKAVMTVQQEVGEEGGARKTAAEEKAAKIQRLKSGFRICKPQGTFLWPKGNNNININMLPPQVVVHVDELFTAPTPPSVSSSTVSAPHQLPHDHQHHPASPLKPLAERRAVSATAPAALEAPSCGFGDSSHTSSTTATTTSTTTKTPCVLINLNELPTNPFA